MATRVRAPYNLRSLRSPGPEDRSPARIVGYVLSLLKFGDFPTELVYADYSVPDAAAVCQRLNEDEDIERHCLRVEYNSASKTLRLRMPTLLHNVHSTWFHYALADWSGNQLLPTDERETLFMSVGDRFSGFSGIYRGSQKEPDYLFQPHAASFPTVVLEAGWSESFVYLYNDKDLWLDGNQITQVVILIKWSKVKGNRVKGVLEKWVRGAVAPIRSTIFPVPSPIPPVDYLEISKGELFGPFLPTGTNANDQLRLPFSKLRRLAELRITSMGYAPA